MVERGRRQYKRWEVKIGEGDQFEHHTANHFNCILLTVMFEGTEIQLSELTIQEYHNVVNWRQVLINPQTDHNKLDENKYVLVIRK